MRKLLLSLFCYCTILVCYSGDLNNYESFPLMINSFYVPGVPLISDHYSHLEIEIKGEDYNWCFEPDEHGAKCIKMDVYNGNTKSLPYRVFCCGWQKMPSSVFHMHVKLWWWSHPSLEGDVTFMFSADGLRIISQKYEGDINTQRRLSYIKCHVEKGIYVYLDCRADYSSPH